MIYILVKMITAEWFSFGYCVKWNI